MRLRTSALLVAAAAAAVTQAWFAGHSLRSSAIIAMFCCNRSRLSCMAPLACASLDSPGTSPAPGSTAMLLDRIRGALWGEQAHVALQPVNRTTSWSLLWTYHQQLQSMQLSLMISFLLAAGVAAVAAPERPPAHPERAAAAPAAATAAAAAAAGIYIADALSMPVHWYYSVTDLKRDFGTITDYQVRKDTAQWKGCGLYCRPSSCGWSILAPVKSSAMLLMLLLLFLLLPSLLLLLVVAIACVRRPQRSDTPAASCL